MQTSLIGPLFVAIASLLWATDSLFRMPTAEQLDPTLIVFFEHVFGVLFLLPWVLRAKNRSRLVTFSPVAWGAALFAGLGGSALAMVLFTLSFRFINPSVSLLLQKLQPVLVVLTAFVFLGERPARKFYFYALVALAAGVVLSFPDLNFDFLHSGMTIHTRGLLYSFGAMVLWGLSTVAGKVLLKRTSPDIATFWRFTFGLLGLSFALIAAGNPIPWEVIRAEQLILPLAYLSTFAGVIAMMFYYSGLKRTSASVTTFVELIYPVGGVLLNTLVLHTPLSPVQMISGAILVFAVTMISV